MSVECVVGLQWGDEGKGKIVDALARDFDMVVRYAGGANAGHTVVFEGNKFILHLIPTGILHPDKTCVVANGIAFDPETFFQEVEELHSNGFETVGRLFVSDRAHVVFPFHKELDKLREKLRGEGRIGTTARGIGPCYADKADRLGIRVGDLMDGNALAAMLKHTAAAKNPLFAEHGFPQIDQKAVLGQFEGYGRRLKPYVTETRRLISETISGGRSVLFEGAQGALLDIDHGTYPFVTSSSTGLDGINSGAGIPTRSIDRVMGVIKAYCTRVGAGPFPTEEHGDIGKHLQQKGGEFGATTGRPRRCGWLDLVAVRYTAAISGADALVLTKLDVLDELEEIKVAVAYDHDGREITEFPSSQRVLDNARPRYETFRGWKEDTTSARSLADLPEAAARYIKGIKELLGIPVAVVSVGNSREQTIYLSG